MDSLFLEQATKMAKEKDIEGIRQALVAQMNLASMEYLSNGKSEIYDLFVAVADRFDGSEYQQGQKDGLRKALALLGNVELLATCRGGALGGEPEFRGKGTR